MYELKTSKHLEELYPSITQWALRHYGTQNGLDYVHDAVINILDCHDKAIGNLTSNAFLGLWRIQVTRAYVLARHSLLSRRLAIVSLQDAMNVADYQDKKQDAKKLVRHMLPLLPFAQRKIIYRLYILGENGRECAKALGLSFQRVNQQKQRAITFLGKLVKQSNLEV